MKDLLYVFLVLAGMNCISCNNRGANCPEVQITAHPSEVNQIQQYLETKNISAQKDERGFYYTIDKKGSGKHPDACSNVTVGYVGKLTNNTVFDQTDKISFDLKNLIAGWQEGIPLIGEGGEITLYLPPSLGYGSRDSGPIPPNSITIFTITLHKVNN